MIQYNRTKIIATIGPASWSETILKKLIEAGTDVFRLNFSHISHADAAKTIKTIRKLNNKLNTSVAVLADLQGPKLRIGKVAGNGITLKSGNVLTITTRSVESVGNCLSVSYENLAHDIKPGEQILIDDGNIVLEALSTDGISEITARVVYGGFLTSNKGFNLPHTKVSLPSLTEKDKLDLQFAKEHNIEWIALSFVRSADDLKQLKHLLNENDIHSKVIAKIEKPEAVEKIDSIIEEADAVMIARGDLGIEMDLAKVPMIQKNIVKKCLEKARPVIIATQMMQSMIESPMPTRAEVNDVANAVLDGADALMLSGETSIGKYPVKVVETMVNIIAEIENTDDLYTRTVLPKSSSERFMNDAICLTASNLARDVKAPLITVMTNSGYTAFRISSLRPRAHIFAFTSNQKLISMMNLVWGVRCYFYDKAISTDKTFKDIQHFLTQKGFANTGDLIVHTASMPIEEQGMTNALKLSKISSDN